MLPSGLSDRGTLYRLMALFTTEALRLSKPSPPYSIGQVLTYQPASPRRSHQSLVSSCVRAFTKSCCITVINRCHPTDREVLTQPLFDPYVQCGVIKIEEIHESPTVSDVVQRGSRFSTNAAGPSRASGWVRCAHD